MIGVIWFLLIVVLVIAQLSQARSKTTLKGRPFEAAPSTRKPGDSSRREASTRLASLAERKDREDTQRDASVGQAPRERIAVGAPFMAAEQEDTVAVRPDLRAAIVWAEIIGPPKSKRKGRV